MMNTTVRIRRDCSPFPPEALERFRLLLTRQQSEVLQSCRGLSHAALGTATDASGDVSDDSADLASEACDRNLSLNFLGRAQMELTEIHEALERIDRRSYGVCDECSQPIPAARLEAIPTARVCLACKSRSETA
jgi:DnaK suppressor protein